MAKTSDEQLRKMIMALIGEVDYDQDKYFDPETSEDPEEAEAQMKRLVELERDIAKRGIITAAAKVEILKSEQRK